MDYFKFTLEDNIEDITNILGPNSENVKDLERTWNCEIEVQPPNVFIKIPSKTDAIKIFEVVKNLVQISKSNNGKENIKNWDIKYVSKKIKNNEEITALSDNAITSNSEGQKFFPKTAGQQEYLKALRESSVVIATGPAGTGKTFMAVMYAYELLRTNQIKRIVITRPIVEAGESIGFLPGDMRMKVDPYLMPLYDSFHILMGKEKTEALITKGVIEIAPLAYMRGRTFNDAFVILDEAQNTTQNQIKMFLTRLGFNSKMVITGDISQIDLKMNQQSALIQALHVLKNVEQIKKIRLTVDDIVRNPLVNEIVKAYEHFDANSGSLFNSRRNR
ncbi:hypothetical protein ASO20_02885 [Mycoplasma sp. (ex Biomphalaria glabrata)]|uniref:PhoH family protein n=1 Tax=Mycoplasma sp. (ex Biomphalaria glabrata) TaxID=1749074 RepID=UPI00073A8BE4|nr:PhoH family protein [Mycoplasma sp. (ex Biomphalaria glabrata)]ALV23579.1 hypothetical protein ASO20_02885 [Mycoplasma sp. (ex Biomphalaria glabrata)]